MSVARRDRAVLTGAVLADGLLFSTGLLAPDEIERRLAAAWRRGSRLYACGDDGVLLAWPAAIRIRAERVPGAPVRRFGGGFAAAPEALLGAPPVACVLVAMVGGAPAARGLEPCEAAAWLRAPDRLALEVAPLDGGAPPPELEAPRPAPGARAVLAVDAPDPARDAVLAALEGRHPAGDSKAARAPRGRLRARLLAWLRARLSLARAARPRGARPLPLPAPQPLSPPAGAQRAGWVSRLWARAARLLMRGRLGRVLGRRQAEYLARTMELLERGDLEEGLRRAIPLASMRDAAAVHRPALGLPGLRAALNIVLGPPSPITTSYNLEGSFFAQMAKLYRATFQRLDAQGRFKEAAFVLAELLREDEEAVAYLESKGELRLSAELAEARAVAPGLVVRQWFLAGDAARAIAVARRHRAFADAVVRLERADPMRALALRMLWADALAEAGRRVAAVDVAWKVPAMRGLIARWIDDGLAEGGHDRFRLLARKLALDGVRWEEVEAHVGATLAGDGAPEARLRLELGRELTRRSSAPCAGAAARLLLRHLYADHARMLITLPDGLASELASLSGDVALLADRPRVSPRWQPPLASVAGPLEITAAESGSLPVHDAVLVSERRVLVALGDAGVRLVDTRGRTVAHFDEPAHRLVPADDGGRVLLLAQRGAGAWRLGRLDLDRRAAVGWCDARLADHARSFDGDAWFAVSDRGLCAFDTHAPGLQAFWSVACSDDDGSLSLARDEKHLTWITGGFGPLTRWRYELPAYVLRSRDEIKLVPHPAPPPDAGESSRCFVVGVSVSPSGDVADVLLELGAGSHALKVRVRGTPPLRTLEAPLPAMGGGGQVVVEQDASWIACVQTGEDATTVSLFDAATLGERLRLRLDGAREASVRFQGERLVVADTQGRVLIYDLGGDGLLERLVL